MTHCDGLKLRSVKTFLVLLLITLFVSGCSLLTKNEINSPTVYLSKTLQWTLPNNNVLLEPFTVLQQVSARYSDQTFDLLFRVENQPSGRLVMAALTPSGHLLLQLNYENGVLTGSTSALLGDKIKLSYMVSDFFLTYGRLTDLRQALEARQVTVSQSVRDNKGAQRTFMAGETTVVSVDYRYTPGQDWPVFAHYKNHALGYELEITTLQGEFE